MPDEVPNLPEPSAELVLLMAFARAYLATASKKDAEHFLREVDAGLGLQEASYNLIRFRPREQDRAVYSAMREAQAWWAQAYGAMKRLGGR